MTKAATIDKAAAERRRKITERWAKRHPDRARTERSLRVSQAKAKADFGHKWHGTIETHAKAAKVRQGSLARLYTAGAITIEQLGAAQEIASVVERIGAGLGVRTVSLETRVDGAQRGDGGFFEALGQVRREVAYGRWRAALPMAAPVLAMIVNDIGVTAAAKAYGMHRRRAKTLLSAALDAWSDALRDARDEVDEATLLAAQAGIL